MMLAVFLHLVRIGLLCLLKVQLIEPTLIRTPSDAVIFLGKSATLQCSTSRKDYPPSWYHAPVGSSDHEVYTVVPNGGKIEGRMVEGYQERMEVVGNRELGEYNLRIKSVQSGDAGRYTCKARGGLGQEASAELIVIESPVQCRPNVSEYICEHGLNNISMSCMFPVSGNSLPEVSWFRTDRLEQILRTETAQRTDENGVATSSFNVTADSKSLNGSSFTCIVHPSLSLSYDEKLRCTTPPLNVLNFEHINESKTLVNPEEVICPQIPDVINTGCKWVRRNLDHPESDIEVTKDKLLNLYKPDMDSGVYVCIVDCSIGERQCSVEALTINYQSSETLGVVSTNNVWTVVVPVVVVVVVVVVLAIIAAIGLTWILRSKKEYRHHRKTCDEPDANFKQTGISREERNRLKEEIAKAKMPYNAELLRQRQGKENGGFSLPEEGDIAEGPAIIADKKRE